MHRKRKQSIQWILNRYPIDIGSGTKRITKITIMPSDTRKGIYTDKEYGQDNMLISIASAALVVQ